MMSHAQLNESRRTFEQNVAMRNLAMSRFSPPRPELLERDRRLLREGYLRRQQKDGQLV